MAKFKMEDYDTVDSRIKKFYKDHPDGAIITELLERYDDFSVVIFKAFVYVDGVVKSTGHAIEKEGAGYVNKDAWLENCETSAIGRALADYGYSGNLRPSREEMMKEF